MLAADKIRSCGATQGTYLMMNEAFLRVSGIENSAKLNFLLGKLSLVMCIIDAFFFSV